MTPEQEMRAIVEKAGECWHEWVKYHFGGHICKHCGYKSQLEPPGQHFASNSHPEDLNELFRLAEKLDMYDIGFGIRGNGCWVELDAPDDRRIDIRGDNPADALRKALYQAVKED